MRQQVTLGYFERDEAGRMRACSRAVIVEAESGDQAAAKALAAHGAELERLSGYDPGQTVGRVAVLGVEIAGDLHQMSDDRHQMTEDQRSAVRDQMPDKKSEEPAARSSRKAKVGQYRR